MNRKVTNMVDTNPIVSRTNSNMNGLNKPIRRQRLSE